jgi:hypothetical protein
LRVFLREAALVPADGFNAMAGALAALAIRNTGAARRAGKDIEAIHNAATRNRRRRSGAVIRAVIAGLL